MKILTLIITLFVTTSVLANGTLRPEPPRRNNGKRAEALAKVKENKEAFDITVKEVIGLKYFENREFKLEISESMKTRELNDHAVKIRDLNEAIKAKRNELAEATKATEFASLLTMYNKVVKARGDIAAFFEQNKDENAEMALKLIDNLLLIVEVKVLEPAGSPVSTGQILRMMNILEGKVETYGMTAQTFKEIEAEITGILPKNYTMAKAARCIK